MLRERRDSTRNNTIATRTDNTTHGATPLLVCPAAPGATARFTEAGDLSVTGTSGTVPWHTDTATAKGTLRLRDRGNADGTLNGPAHGREAPAGNGTFDRVHVIDRCTANDS